MLKVLAGFLTVFVLGCSSPAKTPEANPEKPPVIDSELRLQSGSAEAPHEVGTHPLFPVEIKIDPYLEVRDTEFFTEGHGLISFARGYSSVKRVPGGIVLHISPRDTYRGHTVALALFEREGGIEARAAAIYITDDLPPTSFAAETVSGTIWLKSAELKGGQTLIGRFRLQTKWSSHWEKQEVKAEIYKGTFMITLS